MKEDLFYELNITEDGYVIGRHNHDEADSVSIVGYTEESKHARLFVAAPELLEALQELAFLYEHDEGCRNLTEYKRAKAAIAKALGETK